MIDVVVVLGFGDNIFAFILSHKISFDTFIIHFLSI